MKSDSPPPIERLEKWQAQRRAAFDEIDLTLAVMACIQPAASRYFHSSPLLDAPSALAGLLRMAFVFFLILTPV